MLCAVTRTLYITTTKSPYSNFLTTLKYQMSTATLPPVEASITNKLQSVLTPAHLQVINESYKHKVPQGSETHFKVVIVSDKFQDKSLLDRHRIVNELLKDELATSVHALSIQAKTPKQWEESQATAETPGCIRPANVPMK